MKSKIEKSEDVERAIIAGNVQNLANFYSQNQVDLFKLIFYPCIDALQLACHKGQLEIARFLLDKGMDVESNHWLSRSANRGDRPLRIACMKGDAKLARLLLERGANITLQRDTGLPLIHLAAENGFKEIISLLLTYGDDINQKTPPGFSGYHQDSALHLASKNGHRELVLFLVENGADVNIQNEEENTPLHLACADYQVPVVRTLLDKTNVDFTLINNQGYRPWHIFHVPPDKADTCKNLRNRLSQLGSLLRGRSTEMPDTMRLHEFLLLIKKYKEGEVERAIITEAMRKYGFRLRQRDQNGDTLLHAACRVAYPEVVHWLLQCEPHLAMACNLDKKNPEEVVPNNINGFRCKRLVACTKNQILGIYSLALSDSSKQPKYPQAFFFFLPEELKQKILQHGVGYHKSLNQRPLT